MSDLPDSRHGLGSARPSRWVDQPDVKLRASLFVASNAKDAGDCELLLSMLGLAHSAEEVAAVKHAAVSDTVIQAQEATER